MKKLTKRFRGNEKGFTLIELIVVIAILAVISAIAIPNILSAVENARKTADASNAQVIANAVSLARTRDDSITSYQGFHNISSLDSNNAFEAALLREMNGATPTPKYKGTDATEDFFLLYIDADDVITVYVANAVPGNVEALATAEANRGVVEVYPNADSDYANN